MGVGKVFSRGATTNSDFFQEGATVVKFYVPTPKLKEKHFSTESYCDRKISHFKIQDDTDPFFRRPLLCRNNQCFLTVPKKLLSNELLSNSAT